MRPLREAITVVNAELAAEHRDRLEDLKIRLADAADDLNAKGDAARAARELRDALVLQAVDEGMSTRDIAEAAGLSQSRVMNIVADS